MVPAPYFLFTWKNSKERRYYLEIVIYQVEFLLSGKKEILPFTIRRLQVSERLIIENAGEKYPSSEPQYFAFAYVGSEDELKYFPEAISYIDFFLLIYALTRCTTVTHKVGIALL